MHATHREPAVTAVVVHVPIPTVEEQGVGDVTIVRRRTPNVAATVFVVETTAAVVASGRKKTHMHSSLSYL
jgi:hypothetical protein